jgi:hypothetical protein
LAELFTAQGKFDQAEELNKRALAIREKTLGADHVDFARSKGVFFALVTSAQVYTISTLFVFKRESMPTANNF